MDGCCVSIYDLDSVSQGKVELVAVNRQACSGLHCRYKRKRTALPGVSAIRSILVLILQHDNNHTQERMTSLLATLPVFLVLLLSVATAQIYNPAINLVSGNFNNPPAVNPGSLVHQEVALNAEAEAQLPPELLNPFYKNPRIAAGLAKESWLANKEFPVFHRDTENIPREAIAKIFHNAGFHSNRRRR